MKTVGIVAEYNPFHNGHRHQLSLLREQGYTHIAVVMSGNLVQRGEPALFDKWTRTQAALSCGADLVLELPAPCAVSSAEGFAYGAVRILDALGNVDALCFGAETPDQDALLRVADTCRSLDAEQLAPYLKAGLSFPAAREKAVAEQLGVTDVNLLKEPNNILGIEYCKALLALGSAIVPLPIERVGDAHDGQTPDGGFASASFIRNLLRKGETANAYFPTLLAELYRKSLDDGFYSDPDRLFPVFLAAIGRETPQTLAHYAGCGDGLAERICESAKTATSISELYAGAKSKRFTHSRVRRTVLAAALGLTADFPTDPPYLRVLGANERGHELIKIAAKQENLPLYHSFARLSEAFPEWAAFEQRAELFWRLSCKITPPGKGEYRFLNLHKAKGESL